jgi:hypothetical protein
MQVHAAHRPFAYCNDNPRGEFSDAAFDLSDRFSGRNAAITK